ncbi:cation/H(+) antiporter 28-like [Neltuma alba]|uniref:cation/H(+) antiporter 28-like n=1 Tax=Neltuma alba TaxID=207710 RepID=UPI0010A3D159|nr:cation/H(+) antiporter 28-like [Prosopis alba]
MSNSSSHNGHLFFVSTISSNPCAERLGSLMFSVAKNFIIFLAMVILCNGVHYLLKPYSMPRIISDILVGMIVGNIGFLRDIYEEFNKTFGFIIDFVMMFYMFALGIEMDPYAIFKQPSRDAQIAYAGILSTFIVGCFTTPLFDFFSGKHKLYFTLCLSTLLASTASPVLTRLITSLKISKSDIGKLVIAAGMHSDFLCSLLLSIGYIAMPLPVFCEKEAYRMNDRGKARIKLSIVMGCAVLGQMLFTAIVSPIMMRWVNNENPEGKPMKGAHLVLSVAFMVLICASSTLYDYSPILSAFMAGICLPREGRLSKWVITKINYMLTSIFFPIFFLWMGYEADLRKFEAWRLATWIRLLMLVAIGMASKVAGTVISGAMLGFNWPDSVAIGLLLTTKGHFHIYLAIKVMKCGGNTTTGIEMIIAIFFTVLHSPSVVAHIIKRARKRAPTHRMALQLLEPSSELRILLCVHGPQNVPACINFMEISRGTTDPGMFVCVTDLVELTDELAAAAEKAEGGGDNKTVALNDRAIAANREKVTSSFEEYVDEDGDGITIRRSMAVSTFINMARDICSLADELNIALIVLPFHRRHREDGTLDGGNPGFRHVNRKVLKSAPCSVGILVDRGLGSIEKIQRTSVSINVAVIFVGGKDDREAIAYAGRVARHSGVKLTVIRLLVDTTAEANKFSGPLGVNLSEQEQEMALDDECFAQFYEKHIVGGRIAYMEKHLANSAETFSVLKSFEGRYSLVIVGREGGVNSILTKGMNDWQQCPELGPIGDVLSGPDFSITVSVLIIQQHKLKGELDGLDDDFTVMM